MAKSLDHMKPMERHRYVTSNSAVCPSCKKEKRLKLFWTKETNSLDDVCNVCAKKEYEAEVRRIVLSVLTKTSV